MKEEPRETGYEDILAVAYPFALRHPRMPGAERAAQFSPFAALSGYEEAIGETARRHLLRDEDNHASSEDYPVPYEE